VNQVLKTIHRRQSVRAYEDKPIPSEVRQAILEASMRAPTAGNMMLYTILEVSDQAAKDKLVETCDNQPFIATAPWILIFLADYQRWHDFFRFSGVEGECAEQGTKMVKPQAGDLLLACCDALIAAQTAVIAAESLGVGSCYIGDILENYETHRQMFNLPDYAVPVAMVCFGYPTEGQLTRAKTPRFGAEFIVHADRYRRFNGDDYQRMFEQRGAKMDTSTTEIMDLGMQMYKRKFNASFSHEMRRSVDAMLRGWSER
jgi:nitroreductase